MRGTMSLNLMYTRTNNNRLAGYSNNDWCGDVDDRKNMFGYVFFMKNTTFV